MRSYRFLLVCLALFLCVHSVTAVPQSAVRRQDDSPSDRSQSSTATLSSRPSATVTSSNEDSSASRAESNRASSTAAASKSSAEASTSVQVPVATASTAPQSTSSPEAGHENALPFQPSLTPAMGISGVIMLLSGLAFAVIGIKNKWVYVFGSAAYLTALAVTVLIVYLMNPPVSNGVQGAFFVAAFFTGIIFGAISLVFPDITEGFGCLLGGFCLSMWFLCLKSGGLITSVTGRAIFIGCMSAGGYCLSFSHHTRNYGLIASIAFSGATATILGIDCLGCAGLKEFWLYLWALNDNVFPLDTNIYPVTKNIKAELAGIVIIAALGVVSQLRVWKLVKEHREKSAAQQLEKQQVQEREEEALGRQIEDSFQRERAQWEVAYGDKSVRDSSVASSTLSPKHSTSIRGKDVFAADSLELANIEKSGIMRSPNPDTPAGTTVTVSVLKDDIQQIDAQGNPITYKKTGSLAGSDGDHKDLPATPKAALTDDIVKERSLRPSSVPPPPAIIPLPFKIPAERDVDSDDGDNTSVSAVAETENVSMSGRRPMSKRISDMSNLRQMSGQRNSRNVSESQEDLVNAPHIEDDRASSIAATLDDEHDDVSLRQLSPPHSPIGTEHKTNESEPLTTSRKDAEVAPQDDVQESNAANEASLATEVPADTSVRRTIRQSLTSSTDPKSSGANAKRLTQRDPRFRADTLVSNAKGNSESEQSKSSSEKAPSQSSQTEHEESRVGSLKERALPTRFSKVALSYRTNEWAKHLETADLPELDELSTPASPGAALDHDLEEAPAPVSDEIAAPLNGSQRNSKAMSIENKSSAFLNRSTSTSQRSLAEQQPMSRSPSVLSSRILSRSNSGTQLDALTPLPTNTLMGQRESLIRNRVSSHSFSPLPSPGQTLLEQNDQEDMTLAQRRQLLKQGPTSPLLQHQPPIVSPRRPPPSTAQKWQKKGWAGQGVAPGFDSHQPQRTASSQSNRKREDLYADWRETIRDVSPPQTAAYIAEQQRAVLLHERQQKEVERQQREAVQQQRLSMMDNMMRSGQMLDAHREAMRKMQANANKRAA
ncbi:uncharacterized protein EKO05_0003032 [Ascochyta rabiei]|uniref:TM7S3/TM198-like domain-containing protein n=1 Tax=Didymella rabiei TaxID=5454 RepID=A0A162XEI3_DIDRA|nr:uncharacterized protein EKO05_0003032 [Ascochyta rabiei]KZM19501.1 hypothetical protein ST47_g9400 [Ascochyta rabiei]UPX12487.1 hypothetical protein EKO05_0003032 [Ascochyta rabiei]